MSKTTTLVEIKKEIEKAVSQLSAEELEQQVQWTEQKSGPMNNMICVAAKEEKFKRSLQA